MIRLWCVRAYQGKQVLYEIETWAIDRIQACNRAVEAWMDDEDIPDFDPKVCDIRASVVRKANVGKTIR